MPIIKAFIDGKKLQYKDLNHKWEDLEVNDLDLDDFVESAWRIKPDSKYRPFANAEECWVEMCKHHPFGWVKTKQGTHRLIVLIDEERLMMGAQNTEWSYQTLFNEEFTFVDGIPFGVKVEE